MNTDDQYYAGTGEPVRGDNDTAVPYLARSLDLATLTGAIAQASGAEVILGQAHAAVSGAAG